MLLSPNSLGEVIIPQIHPLSCIVAITYHYKSNFLFVICLSVFRLQWNPIAPSKRRDICSKTRVVIIITLMADLG